MILNAWSAGPNGKSGKQAIFKGLIILILWIAMIIASLHADFETRSINFPWVTNLGYAMFLSILTFFIPLIGVSLIKNSYAAMQHNRKFSMEIIPIESFDTYIHSKSNIVFMDRNGVVLTNDKKAYGEWEALNYVEHFIDFVDLYRKSKG